MRQDMYKVVREPARSSCGLKPGRAMRDVEGESLAPTRESMRPRSHHVHGRTRLKLSALRRYVASRVGQPWNTTYAELRRAFSQLDSTLTDPVDYLDVVTTTSMRDDEVVAHCKFGGVHAITNLHYAYYVHPLTGLLCATNYLTRTAQAAREAQRTREAAEQATRRVLSAHAQLHFVQGQWYEVQLGTLPTADALAALDEPARRRAERRYDTVLGRVVTSFDGWALQMQYGARTLFAQSKRQLSHRELVLHGLIRH
jgi:hypothetical protein